MAKPKGEASAAQVTRTHIFRIRVAKNGVVVNVARACKHGQSFTMGVGSDISVEVTEILQLTRKGAMITTDCLQCDPEIKPEQRNGNAPAKKSAKTKVKV